MKSAVRITGQGFEPGDSLIGLKQRRDEHDRLLSQPGDRSQGRDLIAQVFQHRTDNRNIKLAKFPGKVIDVAVVNLRL